MELAKLDINNTSHIGIYVALGKDKAIVPTSVSVSECKVIEKTLGVECLKHNIAESHLNGVLAKLYNNKVILSKISGEEDIKFFESNGFEVLLLDQYFAVGNLFATNQKQVVLSKEFKSKSVKVIDEFLGVKAITFQVGQLPAIGSYLLVNKNGFAVAPSATTQDIKKIESIFKVKGNIATVNFGDGFIANGMLLNDNGIIVGRKTTGYELIRITDILYN